MYCFPREGTKNVLFQRRILCNLPSYYRTLSMGDRLKKQMKKTQRYCNALSLAIANLRTIFAANKWQDYSKSVVYEKDKNIHAGNVAVKRSHNRQCR